MLMKKNEKGQALIELIIFLPLMITLYSVVGGFANSINGSINQQKITRAYFYYRVQNNSTIPGPQGVPFNTWKQFGMFFIGWRDYFKGNDIPVMPCYKISLPFKDAPQDKCEDKYSQSKTLWVRVGTVYGVCGATYVNINEMPHLAPDFVQSNNFQMVVDRSSCLITQ
jgi:hypothetical protein